MPKAKQQTTKQKLQTEAPNVVELSPSAQLADREMERAFMGTVLAGGVEVLDRVRPILAPVRAPFYADAHNRIYRAALALSDRGEAVEPGAVLNEMSKQGPPGLALSDLWQMREECPTAGVAPTLARMLLELAVRRSGLKGFSDIQSGLVDRGRSLADVRSEVEALIAALGRSDPMDGQLPAGWMPRLRAINPPLGRPAHRPRSRLLHADGERPPPPDLGGAGAAHPDA